MNSREILKKGAACLQCRKIKAKCDSLKPRCSRCSRLSRKCDYASGIVKRPWRSLTEALEARILELELIVHKLTVSSAHDLFLVSEKLLERSQRLGKFPPSRKSIQPTPLSTRLPVSPFAEFKSVKLRGMESPRSDEGVIILGPKTIESAIEQELHSLDLSSFQELPPSLSTYLIDLFLPYRSQYNVLVDISYFKDRLSLPSSHPNSIHPCFLNACYLGACTTKGGVLTAFEPFFLQRTRHFLQQSLMFVDRSTHFLWASLILGVFFAKERRLVECMATVGATARFALACGLIRHQPSVKSTDHSYLDGYILPPPKDKAEAEERIRLAHVVYVGCQALPPLCGFAPAFTNEDRQSLILGGVSLGYDDEKVPTTAEELWRFDLHIKLAILATFERVRIFAHSVTASGYHGHEEEYTALEIDINAQLSSSLALFDNNGLQPQEASNTFNPRIVLAHAALYGSGLILHSVRADDDANSKRKMFECVRALIEICDNGRKNKRHHVGLMNSSHMMNAVRVIARELRRSQAKENAGLSIQYCQSVGLLLDYLDDMTLLFPAWIETPAALKGALIAAASSLAPR